MPSRQRKFVRQAFETVNGAGSAVPLDAIDRRIAAELQAAPRLRIAELARRIGLSGPAAADRLRRLEDTGTLSYRAEVSPAALGYTLCAIVRISPVGGGAAADSRHRPRGAERHRVLPDHRRGLLFHEALPALDRRPRTHPRPVHSARPHHDLDRALSPGPTAPAAHPRPVPGFVMRVIRPARAGPPLAVDSPATGGLRIAVTAVPCSTGE